MVRTRAFDPNAALADAMRVFASQGYTNTSIDDVVKATGVSRYGLYGTFGNKRELFERALEKYTENMGRASFLRLLAPDSGLKDIRATFVERLDHMFDQEEKTACLVVLTAMEMAPHDEDLEAVLNKLMLQMSKCYAIGLEHAQERGEVRADLELSKAGRFLTGAFFGMSVMSRSGFTRESLDAYVDSTLAGLAA